MPASFYTGKMLVLASQSPRRAEILRQAGIPFEVRAADIDESPLTGERAEDYVRRLAKAKALADELGPNARAASVEDAITGADAVLLALWLDDLREVIPQQARRLDGKVVIDPSNPIGFEANGQSFRTLPEDQSSGSIVSALLPAGARRPRRSKAARVSATPRYA